MAKKKRDDESSGKTVVRTHQKKIYIMAGLTALALLMTLLGFLALATGGRFGSAKLTIAGLLGLMFAGGTTVTLIWKNPKLVIDDEFVELVHVRGTVVGQIPIDNIASVELGEEVVPDARKRIFVVHLLLIDAKDRDTWWPNFSGKRGSTITIWDHFEKPASWIRGRIATRLERYRDTRRT